ncbi:MAG: hypothetical protein AAFP84_19105, partial [Actinomycetota bacterium]
PNTKITKQIVIDNRGNVPVTFGHPGGIALDDERGECRVTRATYDILGRELDDVVQRAPKRDDGNSDGDDGNGDGDSLFPGLTFERAFGEWVRQGHHHLSTTGPLGVRCASGVTTIPPGEERAIDLTFRVPSGLDQHTRFVGVYPFYDADLVFVIVPSPKGEQPDDNDT